MKAFLHRWLEFYEFKTEDLDALLRMKKELESHNFILKPALKYFEAYDVSAFHHDRMVYLISDIDDPSLLGSLLLFAVEFKIVSFQEKINRDRYFSPFWMMIVLDKLRKYVEDEIIIEQVDCIKLAVENSLLVIDRSEGLIYHALIYDEATSISQIESKKVVAILFDHLNEKLLFKAYHHNTKTIHQRNENVVQYALEVIYKNGQTKKKQGPFDYYGLPLDYDYFINITRQTMSHFREGLLFDARYYTQKRGRFDEYMICGVQFGESNRVYYYLSLDDSILIHDTVIVPVGKNIELLEARVIEIDYYAKASMPYEFDKIKTIYKKV